MQSRTDSITSPPSLSPWLSSVPKFQLASGLNSATDDSANAADEEYTLWLHSRKRLFGGAQYWRALQEFMLGAAEGSTEEVCASAAAIPAGALPIVNARLLWENPNCPAGDC
jgi:hypothetical protein